ncbi:hypothetical protein D1AOALGA4SA_11055 [Olavius algarvensis Delta 1 endosymbiont]|nr:hypothetical protein D1AOALGA4SA_11055 [Olavius algarvensis Delta 1 endosymbiont]
MRRLYSQEHRILLYDDALENTDGAKLLLQKLIIHRSLVISGQER